MDLIDRQPEERTDKRTETHACDLISRQAAIDAICEDGTQLERQGQYSMTMAERKQRDADILDALPSAQPELIRCKDCKHFHYDMPYVIQDIPVLGHEVCDFWGDGCKTSENGFCSYAERRTDEA